jgi:hypothetical protein
MGKGMGIPMGLCGSLWVCGVCHRFLQYSTFFVYIIKYIKYINYNMKPLCLHLEGGRGQGGPCSHLQSKQNPSTHVWSKGGGCHHLEQNEKPPLVCSKGGGCCCCCCCCCHLEQDEKPPLHFQQGRWSLLSLLSPRTE